ncbi:MAG: ABC transporter permease [Anaerolineae bacterium]|nr:ABC transporter permease [Anaerolineae bacterium]
MKMVSVLVKSLREQRRDLLSLVLTLATAPFFVFIYWLFFGGGSTSYAVLVINQDRGLTTETGTTWNAGDDVFNILKDTVTYENGQPMLRVKRAENRADAERRLKNRDAALLVIIPPDFSQALADPGTPSGSVILVGDRTNTYYTVTSMIAQAALTSYLDSVTRQTRPVQVVEEALGGSSARTEFELYVPGLMILAVLMLIYQAAMVVVREIEAGTLDRLRITRLSAFDLLGGISLSQVFIGVAAVVLTFLTALALDFHSAGPVWVAILVGSVTTFSAMGIALIVACFVRTTYQAFMVSTFVLFLMMFFTGTFMPMTGGELFTLGGHTFRIYEVLAPTHAVVALNKVLTLGESLGAIRFELAALLVLSGLYFAGGVWLFQRTHLRQG